VKSKEQKRDEARAREMNYTFVNSKAKRKGLSED